jgi:hypothetical protein
MENIVNNKTSKLFCISLASIFITSCADLATSLADRKVSVVQKQASYKIKSENVEQYVSLSGDPYDSYRGIQISNRKGIQLNLSVLENGDGNYVTKNGYRVIPLGFACDYSAPENYGELTISYQDPKNLYKRVYAIVGATCQSLTKSEIEAEIAKENESLRIEMKGKNN